uniref:Uncharacterized protein n=1 Tax=Tanacetum cinerariifolium TaxID=118510 RepID=A0A699H5C0_TANCI|nr:hypothetical protein [Tanacetum cinerariifolium]
METDYNYQQALQHTTISIQKSQKLNNFRPTKYNLNPPLEIFKTKYEDPNKEKEENRYALSTLLQQNLGSYRAVKFTSDATVAGINTGRDCQIPHTATETFTFFISNANILACHECSEKSRLYFDDILDKPLHITGIDMSTIEATGESSKMTTGSPIPATPSQLITVIADPGGARNLV